MYRFIGGALLLLLARPALAGDKGEPRTAAQQYQALVKEFKDAMLTWQKAYQAAKTDAERRKLINDYARPDKFVPKFLELAQKNAKDPAAVDALVWVASNGFGGPDSPYGKAMAMLMADHVQSAKIGPVCLVLGRRPTAEGEKFLRAVLEKNPNRDAQGLACLGLALALKGRARGNQAVSKEAEELFERAEKKYGDVNASYLGTVGKAASGELFELRFLAIGKTAPNIEGIDQDGVKFKLSDYRGKVVMLDFWGHW
jgi:hypothetical protein